jgi:hypothetical protein
MKVDPDLKALLKATKKVSEPLLESVERRLQKLQQPATRQDPRGAPSSRNEAA